MNSGSCGAPATTIPNGFHPREKDISALKNESFRHSISSVHFFAAKSRTVALYFIRAGAISGKRTV